MQLRDQAAIVTGGASGLGAATARKLAAQGAKVAVCDLNAKLAESVAAEIGGVAVVCDVSDSASAEAASSAALRSACAACGPSPALARAMPSSKWTTAERGCSWASADSVSTAAAP